MKKIMILAVMVAMILGFSMQANANLPNLVYQLIYDNDLDITWYDYATVSNTWQNHMDWASGSIIDFESTTYNDLRLPSTLGASLSYASETELSGSPGQAWKLSFYIGQQLNFTRNGSNYGIAVRNGDVAATVVSEPISSTISDATLVFAFQKEF